MKTSTEERPVWAGVDWGTSNLRVWVMGSEHKPLQACNSTAGMGSLHPEQFEPVLVELLEPWLKNGQVLPVICCGMAGARQGWSDAGYLSTPVDSNSPVRAHHVQTLDSRISVHILPGIKQMSPADVMRGEETQVAGLLHQKPSFNGTICLPGTHTKWVLVEAGRILRFLTCMSGEMFALLSRHSVLRHSMVGAQWSEEAFDQGVSRILKAPECLASQLFALRAENLLHDVPGTELKSRLSGLLLGAELASTRKFWHSRQVTIVGDDTLAGLYAQALAHVDCHVSVENGDKLALAGLIAYHRNHGDLTQ